LAPVRAAGSSAHSAGLVALLLQMSLLLRMLMLLLGCCLLCERICSM
jgi:hypothetical protein